MIGACLYTANSILWSKVSWTEEEEEEEGEPEEEEEEEAA